MTRYDMADAIRSVITEQREEITALKAENDKLREQLADVTVSMGRVEERCAKLRELVRYMWFADYAGHFSTLPEHQEHQANVWQRMHELGVEVLS